MDPSAGGIHHNRARELSDAVADRLFSNGDLFNNGDGQLDFNILRIGMGSDGEPCNGQSCYNDINGRHCIQPRGDRSRRNLHG